MTIFQTIALLLTFAALGAWVNARFFKLPATIGLMVFALLLSLSAIGLNRLGLIDLTHVSGFISRIDFSDILLHGMLSFLLFAGALHINIADLKKHHTIIIILATVGTMIATFVTGSLVWCAAGWLGLSLSYIHALLFGSLIAPTDPVAVLGILKETKISKNLRIKIASESLLNDGVAVVMFLIFLNMADPTTPNLTLPEIGGMLLWEGLGSVILGLTLGWLTYRFVLQIDDYKIEVLATLALAAGGYCLAEAVHLSAPITMVLAGLVMGNHGRMFGMSQKTRVHLDMFWELLDEILNTVLFMLIGLEMIVITITPIHLAIGLMAIIAMLVGRLVSVAIPVSLMGLRYRFERGTILLMTWGGLRGGISIAMALSIPAGVERDFILALTYITVVFSVLFQGTTFRHVVKGYVRKGPSV